MFDMNVTHDGDVVAPFVGAWIEIIAEKVTAANSWGRSVRRSVD